MNRWIVFLLRAILAAAFSVILTRLFHPEKEVVFMACIAGLLLGLAYVSEYVRTGRTDNQGDNSK